MDEDAYQAYRSVIISPTLRSIWAEAYGDRFWSELDPPWTQATNDDVRFVMDYLRPTVGSKLVDLGCGSGCFLRQAARDRSQHIVGIDANPMAIRLAKERCAGFQDNISFQEGDIDETGFPAAIFDGAVSLDVLLFVPDKEKVLREVRAYFSLGQVSRAPPLNSGQRARRCLLRHSTPIRAPSRRRDSSWRSTKR
jgi:2-polyprenyl-3-methyl-5-hydroxy-6-metoxy-1,4-benzoquinol methylase